MTRRLDEVSRKGCFVWYYNWIYDEYELHHVSVGILMTIDSYMVQCNEDGTVYDKLWKITEQMLFDYFSTHDAIPQRCMVKQVFSL